MLTDPGELRSLRSLRARHGFWVHASRLGLAIAVSCLATACYTMPRLTKVTPSEKSLASYSLGEIQSVATGSLMIERVEGTLLLPGFVLAPSSQLALHSLPTDRTIWPAHYLNRPGFPGGSII